MAPALAAGNCCILKPSEMASLTCLELAAIAHEAGLPAGVLSVLTGLGATAGAPLTWVAARSHARQGCAAASIALTLKHPLARTTPTTSAPHPHPLRSADPRVAKIAFTGSTATGKGVNLAAANNLRPATMELGGKSALIVFDDADVDKAVEWAMFGSFWTNGQICSATSRLLLQRGIAPRFLAALKRRAESISVGDPLRPGCRLGPLVCESQYQKVMGYVQVRRVGAGQRQAGATVAGSLCSRAGGHRTGCSRLQPTQLHCWRFAGWPRGRSQAADRRPAPAELPHRLLPAAHRVHRRAAAHAHLARGDLWPGAERHGL